MRTDDLYLVDLIESADAIESIVRGLDLDTFAHDDRVCSAVLWKLVIIGESSSKLSAGSRERFFNIPWEQIRGFRNRMVHSYFTLEWPEVWAIVTNSVPSLRAQAESILTDQFPDVFRQLQERRAHGSREEDA